MSLLASRVRAADEGDVRNPAIIVVLLLLPLVSLGLEDTPQVRRRRSFREIPRVAPAGFEVDERAGYDAFPAEGRDDAHLYPRRIRHPRTGMYLVLVPESRFRMGSAETEIGRGEDETAHWVHLTKPYYLGETEVTQGQWRAVMGRHPNATNEDHPVEGVSWDDAQRFLMRINLGDARGLRLPTEAEWENACRARSTTPFHCGETITTDQANFDGRYSYGPAKLGTYRRQSVSVRWFPANRFGLYEMHGNVWEWCADWHGRYSADDTVDPTGPIRGFQRVLRGGAWDSTPQGCRSALRGKAAPSARAPGYGFRVACSLPEQ